MQRKVTFFDPKIRKRTTNIQNLKGQTDEKLSFDG